MFTDIDFTSRAFDFRFRRFCMLSNKSSFLIGRAPLHCQISTVYAVFREGRNFFLALYIAALGSNIVGFVRLFLELDYNFVGSRISCRFRGFYLNFLMY